MRCSDPPPVPMKSSRTYSRPSAAAAATTTTTGDKVSAHLESFIRCHRIYANRSVEGSAKISNNRVDLLGSLTTTPDSNVLPQQTKQLSHQLLQQPTDVYSNVIIPTRPRSNGSEVTDSSHSESDRLGDHRCPSTSLPTSQTSVTTSKTAQSHHYAVANQFRTPKTFAYDEVQNYYDGNYEEHARNSRGPTYLPCSCAYLCCGRLILSVLATVVLSIGITILLFFFVALPFDVHNKQSNDDQLLRALQDQSPVAGHLRSDCIECDPSARTRPSTGGDDDSSARCCSTRNNSFVAFREVGHEFISYFYPDL